MTPSRFASFSDEITGQVQADSDSAVSLFVGSIVFSNLHFHNVTWTMGSPVFRRSSFSVTRGESFGVQLEISDSKFEDLMARAVLVPSLFTLSGAASSPCTSNGFQVSISRSSFVWGQPTGGTLSAGFVSQTSLNNTFDVTDSFFDFPFGTIFSPAGRSSCDSTFVPQLNLHERVFVSPNTVLIAECSSASVVSVVFF
jgi:hypothetical protein